METFLYILIPNILIVIYLLKSALPASSDHFLHVSWVDRIKKGNHRFIMHKMFSLNEKYAWYPQLFHWFISFLPARIYKEKHSYINVGIKILEIIGFNVFLLFLYNRLHFDKQIILYANIIVNIFPFSYAVWNAKNMGLSARGIGLVLGQIYTYLIVAYIITDNLYLLIPLLAIVFIILLMSLITMQYVLFSLPFYVFFFRIPEIILLPFLSVAIFYLTMPQVAINNLVGQFNHKRNYALFMASIFILRNRPSIYRDFVYDFWVKLRQKLTKGIFYMFFNPIVEIIYGLPFLWLVLYFGIQKGYSSESEIIYLAVISALGMFFLTSFSWTRFLGEPQRYLEFVIPCITILYVLNFGPIYHLILVSSCILFTISSSYILNKLKTEAPKMSNMKSFIDFIQKEEKFKGSICITNDHGILKYFSNLGLEVLRPDFSVYFLNKEKYYVNYYKNNYYVLSPQLLKTYHETYRADLLVLNKELYTLDVLAQVVELENISLIQTFGNYELYKLQSLPVEKVC
ncbi:MAG: hypothetical protein V4608_01470 [Bacteroidota bacterium]